MAFSDFLVIALTTFALVSASSELGAKFYPGSDELGVQKTYCPTSKDITIA